MSVFPTFGVKKKSYADTMISGMTGHQFNKSVKIPADEGNTTMSLNEEDSLMKSYQQPSISMPMSQEN